MSKANPENGTYRVGVLLGGRSNEREISLKSGHSIYEALKSLNLSVTKIDTRQPIGQTLKSRPIQTAFLALHGAGGEDGTIQRELDLLKIPYTGSSARQSAIAFNKDKAKKIFIAKGIPTPAWVVVTRKNYRRKLKNFPFPAFTKPVSSGSSIGITLVKNYAEFCLQNSRIFNREQKLLVEAKVTGREITVGVLKNRALPVIELQPKRPFFDYKAKYTSGQTRYVLPAPLSSKHRGEVQKLALRAHRVLGLRDFSRVDILLDEREKPFVLEVNAIPGFTDLSLFPKAAQAAGISFKSLCHQLLKLAERRKNSA